MRLVLYLDPSPVEFCEPTADGAYPYLLEVGELVNGARAGEAIGLAAEESANVTVRLDNCGRRAASIIRRALRVPAEIFGDDGAVFFFGFVAVIDYVPTLALEIGA